MSAESIEARTHELMSMQKVELARLLARAEDELGPIELWDAPRKPLANGYFETPLPPEEPLFGDEKRAEDEFHARAARKNVQGTDPEIIDVAPASLVPEVLEPSPLLTDVLHPDLLEAIAPAFANAAIEGADAAPAEPEAQ